MAGVQRKVTRDVEPVALPDLLERPIRASVAFVDEDAVDVLPARASFAAGTHSFGVSEGPSSGDLHAREVVLIVDDGPYWFELRGISVRGIARRIEPPLAAERNRLTWYAIEPQRILAWDYGTIREE
jgi:hypothetical protein